MVSYVIESKMAERLYATWGGEIDSGVKIANDLRVESAELLPITIKQQSTIKCNCNSNEIVFNISHTRCTCPIK